MQSLLDLYGGRLQQQHALGESEFAALQMAEKQIDRPDSRAALFWRWMLRASALTAAKSRDASNRPSNPPQSHRAILFSSARAVPIDDAPFRAGVERVTDWDQLLAAADFHGLTPLLAAAIERACRDVVPVHVLRTLNDSRRQAIALNLVLSNELTRLLTVLNREGISALPLKGPALAEALYTDPALRPCSDLDILIRRQDVPEVMRILQREEYEIEPYLARMPVPVLLNLDYEAPLRHRRGTRLDIHWEIARRDYPFCFDAEVLWNSIIPAHLAGKDVFGVAPESLLVFLCAHGTKHMWARLLWLADLDRLTRKNLDWAGAFSLATRIGCERPLFLGLLLAHEALDSVIPEPYLKRARAERTVLSLVEQVMRLYGCAAEAHPSSLELTIFSSRLADRWWDKVRHYAALLKAPTDVELRWLRLPKELFLLYYPLRLSRLIAKYGTRLLRSR